MSVLGEGERRGEIADSFFRMQELKLLIFFVGFGFLVFGGFLVVVFFSFFP